MMISAMLHFTFLFPLILSVVDAGHEILRDCRHMTESELEQDYHKMNGMIPILKSKLKTSNPYDKKCVPPSNVRSIDTSDTSSCPWYYDLDTDRNRYPENITIAKRKCCNFLQQSSCSSIHQPPYCLDFRYGNLVKPNPNGLCEPISVDIVVFRKQCASCCYSTETFRLNVGFGCSFRSVHSAHTHTLSSRKNAIKLLRSTTEGSNEKTYSKVLDVLLS